MKDAIRILEPHSAPRDQAHPLLDLDPAQYEAIVAAVPGGANNVQDLYPLSPLQEGMLFHHLLSGQRDTYVLSTLFELASRAHVDALMRAFQTIIDRHDVLRTAVLWEGLSQPVQVVHRHAALSVEEFAVASGRDPEAELRALMKPGRVKLDLRRAPVMRLQIAKEMQGPRWLALLHVHHVICDHESLDAIASEAIALLDGRSSELPPTAPYRTFVAEALARNRDAEAEAFFRDKLGDLDEPTALFGLTGAHADNDQIEECREVLDLSLALRIRTQARRADVSPARLFHAAWATVVALTSGREDVVLGTVVRASLQRRSSTHRMLGMAVNTVPLRLKLAGLSVAELIQHTNDELSAVLNHSHTPLTLAQRCSGLEGNTPLITSLFNCRRSTPVSTAAPDRDAGIRVLTRGEAWANYPAAVTVDDLGEGFALTAQADKRIDPARLNRLLCSAMQALVEAVQDAPERLALELPLLPLEERRLVVQQFNATRVAYPTDQLAHELFEAQVTRAPDQVAVVCGDEHLTYSQLNRRANIVAHALLEQGVRPDDRVAVFLERGLDLVVALLAILKAGGAYVPLDVTYPKERLEHVLKDSAPIVVLTLEGSKHRLPLAPKCVIALDALEHDAESASQNLPVADLGLNPRHMAYLIYTSGSTGTPKGVMVEHRNLTNLIHWHCAAFQVSPICRCSSLASVGFDAATWEIWPTLSAGATLVLAPPAVSGDTGKLLEWWAGETLDISFLPTPVAEFAFSRNIRNPLLRTLLIGGDQLRHRPSSARFELVNNYGPTEVTVLATSGGIHESDAALHIGRPIANTQVYILNAQRQPVPIGVVGEIYIGGAGVARGYLNKPELTQERFVRDPFSAEAEARMYKTGDLGRWRTDGTIEYLGRNDHQVKIRGFRIELGEIEAQLVKHSQVREAVVLAREDMPGEKRLVGYVVALQGASPPIDELRVFLKASLPDYMVPSAFVMLEQLPLTSNGKLDRRALPPPDQGSYGAREYQAPEGQIEAALAEIWQSLLGVERVGREDNFFELGGHSLLIVQLLERLRRAGLGTDVRRVFERPSLAALASALTSERIESVEVLPNLIPSSCESITPQMLPLISLEPTHIERIVRSVPGGAANIQDIYPLAPLQEGILFHHVMKEGQGDVYVIPTLLRLSSKVRRDQLIEALQRVLDRHDILHSAILWEQLPQPVQVVYRRAVLPVEEIELDDRRDLSEQVQEWLRPERQQLDLRRAPLMRLQVAADPHSDHWYALLQLHHIVGDGESLRLVIGEVVAQLRGEAQVFASAPYREHVAQALAYAHKHDAEQFFRRKLADIDEPTAPFGLLEVHGDGSQIEEAREALAPPLAERIRRQARRLGVSAATLFHAAWGLVVAHSSGRDDVVFGSVLLGRMQGDGSAQRMLGMFINTLPLRLPLQGLSAAQLVEQTQRELMEVLGHEQASLAIAQRCSGIDGTAPLFTALLNYRHSQWSIDSEWTRAEGIEVLGSRGLTNYPITLSVDDLGEGFALTAQTDRRIDPKRMTGYLRCALESLVDALEEAPQRAALTLPVVPVSERQEVAKFNATERGYRRDRLIHELFESQVQQTPDAIAAVFQEQQLTYAQLNAHANRLAHLLRSRGVGPDRLVGICVDRSLEMLVGLLGILKAGGAYVPLDPNYPADRLQYMMADAAPSVVLTQEHLRNVFPATQAEVIALDSLDLSHDVDASVGAADLRHEIDAKVSAVEPGRQPNADLCAREPGHETDEGLHTAELGHETNGNLSPADLGLTPEHLLYVIYTSGSTGRPKGTAMSHGAMVNLIEWHREHLPATNTRVLQFAALSFDVAFQETFSTLCTGGTLVMLEEWVRRDARALMDLLHAQSIERLFVPPLMLQSLAEQFRTSGVAPSSLRDIITAGEQLRVSPEIVALCEQLPGCPLHNHYGPTETHVVTALTLTGDPQRWPALPSIGAPIANTQMYVLDRRRQPVPLGAVGEVYLGGVGLARGYLHRPELAAERFIADPFRANRHARMYRTGDLGRWRADGTLEYLGRNDDQVKLRGYRIELGEIEAQLARHPQVREAAVIVREEASGEKRLVAYVTPRASAEPHIDASNVAPRTGAELSSDALKTHLKDALPDYMVPSAFVTLAQLPLTPSGKLNRRALPAPDPNAYASTAYQAPEGEVEQALAAVWQQLLHVPRISRDDNFFALGGNSLLAMRVVARIHSSLSIEVPTRVIFKSPTLRELAADIEELHRAHLLERISSGELEIEELLERVAAMPDSRVQQLLGQLTMGGQS